MTETPSIFRPETVQTEFPLSDDQKMRFLRFLVSHGRIDTNGQFTDAEGMARTLASCRLTATPEEGVQNGETNLDGVDDIRFGPQAFIYLEDTEGKLTGQKVARGVLRSSWHLGAIFADDEENLWFCGYDDPATATATFDVGTSPDAPVLRRISPQSTALVRQENGELSKEFPAEGEFWLTDETPARITSIPWWGDFGGGEQAPRLEAMRQRVRDLEDVPAPA